MSRRSAIVFLVVFASCLRAQTITVHLINGENGKPVGGKNVTISSAGFASKILIKEAMEKGFVPGNDCSKKVTASAEPGEVVFFAKLIPWWWPDMQ